MDSCFFWTPPKNQTGGQQAPVYIGRQGAQGFQGASGPAGVGFPGPAGIAGPPGGPGGVGMQGYQGTFTFSMLTEDYYYNSMSPLPVPDLILPVLGGRTYKVTVDLYFAMAAVGGCAVGVQLVSSGTINSCLIHDLVVQESLTNPPSTLYAPAVVLAKTEYFWMSGPDMWWYPPQPGLIGPSDFFTGRRQLDCTVYTGAAGNLSLLLQGFNNFGCGLLMLAKGSTIYLAEL